MTRDGAAHRGPSCRGTTNERRNEMTHELNLGDRVEGGTAGTEDYDSGRVDKIDGDQVTVSWDSLAVTTQHESVLTKIN